VWVEDATDIILNLKQVPHQAEQRSAEDHLPEREQPGVVTSAQIEEDADFAVLDKSVYIATVSEGGKLQIEMRVKNGRGYVAADRKLRRRPAHRLHPGGQRSLARFARSITRSNLPVSDK